MDNVTGKFRFSLTIAGVVYTYFEMREATVQDMTDAEMGAAQAGGGVHTPIAFNGHMMVRQLVSVSNDEGAVYDGPFTFAMLQRLKAADYRALRTAQQEVDQLGEAE